MTCFWDPTTTKEKKKAFSAPENRSSEKVWPASICSGAKFEQDHHTFSRLDLIATTLGECFFPWSETCCCSSPNSFWATTRCDFGSLFRGLMMFQPGRFGVRFFALDHTPTRKSPDPTTPGDPSRGVCLLITLLSN